MKPIKLFIATITLQFFIAILVLGQGTNNVIIDLSKEIYDDKIEVEILDLSFKNDRDTLFFPAVILGMYEENNFGHYIEGVYATYQNGDVKKMKQKKKNLFILKDAKQIKKISYSVISAIQDKTLFAPAATYFDNNGAFLLNFHAIVGYSKSTMNHPYAITIKKHEDLIGVGALEKTNLENLSSDIISAKNYHELIDSPFLYSKYEAQDTTEIQLNKGTVQIAIAPNIYNIDADSIKEVITPILNILENDSLFSTLFEGKYCLLFCFTDEYSPYSGALEHNKSSVYYFNDTIDFNYNLKEIVAHEILHILTPLNLRSERIDSFDFINPIFSKHLWLYEGVTEYLAIKANFNANLIDTSQFFRQLRMNYDFGKHADITSLTEFSENILNKKNQDNYGAIYTQGAITAFYLDFLIAKESNGEQGISDLLAYAMKSKSKGGIFNEETFFKDLESKFPIVKYFFENMIISSNTYPFDEYMDELGVSFEQDTVQKKSPYLNY